MKWLKRIALGIVGLAVLAVGLVFALSQRKLTRTIDVPRETIVLPTDSISLARGQHLATAIGKCGACHGDNFGGTSFVDDNAFGHVPAPNLTRGKGGVGATLTDADYERAIRHGIGPDGKALIIMPAEAFNTFSNADVLALIAYLRTRPPVDNTLAVRTPGPIMRMLLAINAPLQPANQIDQAAVHASDVVPAVSVEYGRYLAVVGGCTSCHNPSLSGGPIAGAKPGEKAPANLTPGGLVNWTLGDFRRALREGVRPQGTAIDSVMPWRYTKLMTDDEIDAVWKYLQSMPAKAYGVR